MKFNYYKMLETNYCEVFVDKSRSNGILHFTHELTVLFQFSWVSGRWIFVVANEIGLDDVDYETEEAFNDGYPDLLDSIKEQLADMRKQ